MSRPFACLNSVSFLTQAFPISLLLLLTGLPCAAVRCAEPATSARRRIVPLTTTDLPPAWAMWQRHVLEQLYPAAREFVEKYTREDASIIWRDEWPGMDGSDDGYESFYNFPLYYALGGQLANLNPSEPRRVILQAGMFAEHEFAGVRQVVHYPYQFDTIDARRFEVALVPGAVGRLEIDLRRYVHPPTYAFPWHDDPVFVSPEE